MKKPKAKSNRTTINLDVILIERAHDIMLDEGYGNNFSAFVAELVRQRYAKWKKGKKPTK